ncbi:pol-like protein [Apostichopus japonicus]|uniref:Pol-like protein n=1 Tax=Stichopus japonicus TaxID=307972 RepID=A0A2G8KB99_STIJA|nr:pol-like protein [Apostichopus japonicus]
MPDIVGPLQTCAVRGKCIQHNLWLIRDSIEFVKFRDLPCALVSLDQEKAFDMLDHDFLFRTLQSFGLNSVFIRWVSLLYKDVTSIVTVNGFTSGPFPVRRGVRQGCPLSPLLYVLFSETISTSLDRCLGFRPFNVPGGARFKCVQYADDVTCIVSNLASFKPLSKVLATGARIQDQRAAFGGWRGQSLLFDATWSDVMIKVNGIWLGYGAPEATTWAERADQVDARLDTFSHRWLSLPGKVTVVKVYCSSLWYPGTVIAAPDHALVRLERIIFYFIWGKRKPNLMKRTVLYKTPLSGGLGLVHLPSKLRFLLKVFLLLLRILSLFALFVRFWGGFLFRHHWPGSFSNNRPKATRPSGVYTQIGDSLRRIKEGGPHVLLNVAPVCYTHHCFVQCSRLCARRLAKPPSLQIVAVCVLRHIWNSRCRLVFDGDVWRAEDVVPLLQSDIRLRMEADHARLPDTAFRRRRRKPVVYYRDGVPRMKFGDSALNHPKEKPSRLVRQALSPHLPEGDPRNCPGCHGSQKKKGLQKSEANGNGF